VDFSLRVEVICPFAFWDLGKVSLFSSVQDNFQEHFFVDDGITLKNHNIWWNYIAKIIASRKPTLKNINRNSFNCLE
jgi:hypothetical protein